MKGRAVEGRIEDLGVSLRLQYGTAYALSDEQTDEIIYALKGEEHELAAHEGERVRVRVERRETPPGHDHEYDILYVTGVERLREPE